MLLHILMFDKSYSLTYWINYSETKAQLRRRYDEPRAEAMRYHTASQPSVMAWRFQLMGSETAKTRNLILKESAPALTETGIDAWAYINMQFQGIVHLGNLFVHYLQLTRGVLLAAYVGLCDTLESTVGGLQPVVPMPSHDYGLSATFRHELEFIFNREAALIFAEDSPLAQLHDVIVGVFLHPFTPEATHTGLTHLYLDRGVNFDFLLPVTGSGYTVATHLLHIFTTAPFTLESLELGIAPISDFEHPALLSLNTPFIPHFPFTNTPSLPAPSTAFIEVVVELVFSSLLHLDATTLAKCLAPLAERLALMEVGLETFFELNDLVEAVAYTAVTFLS